MIRSVDPFLMFNDQLDEALKFYTTVFGESVVLNARYGPDGKVFSATFRLAGSQFMAFNGGQHFQFSDGFSLMVSCTTQEDVDRLWVQLSEGGATNRCGWLTDKFGVRWQVVPVQLMELLGHTDTEVASYALKAMMGMTKIEIDALTRKA